MDTQEAISHVSDKPKVSELISEFKRCGATGDHFGRMIQAEDTRLARWNGQSADGKKHAEAQDEGTEVFPWEGASDIKCYQADGAVNETVALLYMAFFSSALKIGGTKPDDLSDSSTATTFLDWMVHSQLLRQLDTEVELSAQYMQGIGAVGLHVTWEREIGRKLVKVKLQELQQMALAVGQSAQQGQQIPPEQMQLAEVIYALPRLIADPTLEKMAMEAIKYLYEEYATRNLPEELEESDVLLLSDKRARAAIRSLRTDGEAEFPMPYLCRNQPEIRALKPYRDFVLPTEAGDVQSSPIAFVRVLMTETDIRKMKLADEWNEKWIEEAVKTKGKFSTWQLNNPYSIYGMWNWRAVDNRSWYIETVYAYYKQIDDDGVTQVHYTVFSPHISTDIAGEPFVGKDGIANLPRAEYPLIVGRRERFDRSWLATRGLPEILHTSQNVEKAMTDGIVDLASITVVPTMLVPKGPTTRLRIGPAVQNEYVPGREPKNLSIDTRGFPVAETVMTNIERKVARYAGLFHPDVPPQLSAIMQQPMVKKFLIMWAEALQMAYELTMKFAPEQIEKVTGQRPRDVEGYNLILHFDAMQFQPDLQMEKIKAFSQLAAEDPTGTIDQAGLKRFQAMMIDPGMARELVLDQGQASKRIFKDVMNDVLNMFAGSEALYDDASNDAAAPMKLQYAQQIVGNNPNFLGSLDPQLAAELLGQQAGQQVQQIQQQGGKQPDERFNKLLQNYFKNLQQGKAQQENKQIGRTGVKQITGMQQ